jgi:hypothetical protein
VVRGRHVPALADDHRRSPDQLTGRIRAATTQAADSAGELDAA